MGPLHGSWLLALRTVYRPVVRRALKRGLLGREFERGNHERGRFLAHHVRAVERDLWRRLNDIDFDKAFAAVPTWGNRHNVFLAAITLTGYQALAAKVPSRDYAVELLGNLGWQIYMSLVRVPRLVGKVARKDPQERLELIIRSLLWFPFSAPGRPGYEVRTWSDREGFHTHFTCCPPYEFFKAYTQEHGDGGELEAFRGSWCKYDWALTYALLNGGYAELGSYRRDHTMSHGDPVCDMCWSARPDTTSPST